MSTGRRTLPVIVQGIQPGDLSQKVDGDYFQRNPTITEYTRDFIPGESPEPMPRGTKVIVRRIGCNRARAFVPPQEGLN